MNRAEAIKIIREYKKLNKLKPLFIARVSAMHFEREKGVNMILEKPVRDNHVLELLRLLDNDLTKK
jgi:hypothetical protein